MSMLAKCDRCGVVTPPGAAPTSSTVSGITTVSVSSPVQRAFYLPSMWHQFTGPWLDGFLGAYDLCGECFDALAQFLGGREILDKTETTEHIAGCVGGHAGIESCRDSPAYLHDECDLEDQPPRVELTATRVPPGLDPCSPDFAVLADAFWRYGYPNFSEFYIAALGGEPTVVLSESELGALTRELKITAGAS